MYHQQQSRKLGLLCILFKQFTYSVLGSTVSNRIVISIWIQVYALSLRSCCLCTHCIEIIAAVELEHIPDVSGIIGNTTSLRIWAFLMQLNGYFFMNLPGRVEQNSISLESNFSCPSQHRGTGGNFFILLASFTGARGQDVHVLHLRGQSFAKFPCLMETRWKLESRFSATEVRVGCSLDGISEFRRYNPLSFLSPAPLLRLKTKSQFQRYSLSLCVAQILFFFNL